MHMGRRALEKWKEWDLMNTGVTVVGSDSSSRILDKQEYIGNSNVLLLSLDLSQCRPRVGCRPSTARYVTDAATYSTLQHRPLRSGPRDCSHSPHTLYIKNLKKIRPPARISSKISDDKQLIFFYSALSVRHLKSHSL